MNISLLNFIVNFLSLFKTECQMARRKKKNETDEKKEYKSVKLALASIIRPPFRLPLITFISELSIKATTIALLASLLFLFKV